MRRRLIVASIVVATVLAGVALFFLRESPAKRCDRLGRTVYDRGVQLFVHIRDESGTKQAEVLRAFEEAAAALAESGCDVDPLCDYEPAIYDDEHCAEG